MSSKLTVFGVTFALLVLGVFGEADAAVSNLSYRASILWSGPQSVVVSGQYAYVSYAYGMEIYDLSDPAQQVLVSRLPIPGTGHNLAFDGNTVYFAAGDGGLNIADVSDASAPSILGHCQIDGDAVAVAVSGDYAFVASTSNGITVVDVADHNNPSAIAHIQMSGSVYDVAIMGTYALVANSDIGVQIIDIAAPATPSIIGAVPPLAGRTEAIAVSGTYAFIANYLGSLQVIDLADPEAPLTWGASTTSRAQDIVVTGNRAYIGNRRGSDGGGLDIYDISNPESPILIGHSEMMTHPNRLAILGDYLVTLESDFVPFVQAVLDVSNPADVAVVSSKTISGKVMDTKISGNVAAVAVEGTSEEDGLYLIDISNPESPTPVGFIEMSAARFVYLDGNYAYVSRMGNGLDIVDISDPANPFVTSNYYIGGDPGKGQVEELIVRDNLAYVTLMLSGMLILDVSDPYNPVQVGMYPAYLVEDIALIGNYALLTPGIDVVDISDPADPELVTTFSVGEYMITVNGNYAYLAGRLNGSKVLSVVDFSDAFAPHLLTQIELPYRSYSSMSASGNYLLVPQFTDGLLVYDVSIPSSPLLVGEFNTSGGVERVAAPDGELYVADSYGFLVLSAQLPEFRAGDPSGDGLTNISDIVYIIDYVFKNGPAPAVAESADANGDCTINIADAIYLVNYVFRSGPMPVYPDCP